MFYHTYLIFSFAVFPYTLDGSTAKLLDRLSSIYDLLIRDVVVHNVESVLRFIGVRDDILDGLIHVCAFHNVSDRHDLSKLSYTSLILEPRTKTSLRAFLLEEHEFYVFLALFAFMDGRGGPLWTTRDSMGQIRKAFFLIRSR